MLRNNEAKGGGGYAHYGWRKGCFIYCVCGTNYKFQVDILTIPSPCAFNRRRCRQVLNVER